MRCIHSVIIVEGPVVIRRTDFFLSEISFETVLGIRQVDYCADSVFFRELICVNGAGTSICRMLASIEVVDTDPSGPDVAEVRIRGVRLSFASAAVCDHAVHGKKGDGSD